MEYIIVQAGGKGTRMGALTANKPKALLPVNGAPLLLHLMRMYPLAKFIVIADHKKDVLAAYLALFAPSRAEVIVASGSGNCCGIRSALERVPMGKPFALVWSDLYFRSECFPPEKARAEANWIGLSQSFPCRWRFLGQGLQEAPSVHDGVGGVFLFKDKDEIRDVPDAGEICHYLQQSGIAFRPFPLAGVTEFGTQAAYADHVAQLPRSRPFNDIIMRGAIVEKRPRDAKGAELAAHEQGWYQATQAFQWEFVPRVDAYNPLALERIDGPTLHQAALEDAERVTLLGSIVAQLKAIHGAYPPRPSPGRSNDYEALVGKTYRRLESIRSLLPEIEADYFHINGRRCLNFFKHWTVVEELAEQFFPRTYQLLHGDPTFSNMLYRRCDGRVFFIDPRGYYGHEKLFGDVDYDWAKLYYSLVGNFDQFNSGHFRLDLKPGDVRVQIGSNGWEHLRTDFLALTECDPEKIQFLHAIIWLSLASYAWDDYDAICAAFFNGTYHMQQIHKQTVPRSSTA